MGISWFAPHAATESVMGGNFGQTAITKDRF
jgi:hypothetical protein